LFSRLKLETRLTIINIIKGKVNIQVIDKSTKRGKKLSKSKISFTDRNKPIKKRKINPKNQNTMYSIYIDFYLINSSPKNNL